MSEAELGWLRQRAHEARAAKARRGELDREPAQSGMSRRATGGWRSTRTSGSKGRSAWSFRNSPSSGSARQVLLWMHQEQVTLPIVARDAVWGDRVLWRRPHYNSILNLLQNPIYAGAYAFGRTETRTRVIEGTAHKSRGHHRRRADWFVLLRDHHEGYISWDTYERHQQLLADNAQMKGQMAAGAIRGGRSVLAGLLRCAACGRRLHVAYSNGASRYSCRRNHQVGCGLAFGGPRVEAAIERELLRVLTPGAIEAALAERGADRRRGHGRPAGARTRTARGAVRGRARSAAVRRGGAREPARGRHAGAALERGARTRGGH